MALLIETLQMIYKGGTFALKLRDIAERHEETVVKSMYLIELVKIVCVAVDHGF